MVCVCQTLLAVGIQTAKAKFVHKMREEFCKFFLKLNETCMQAHSCIHTHGSHAFSSRSRMLALNSFVGRLIFLSSSDPYIVSRFFPFYSKTAGLPPHLKLEPFNALLDHLHNPIFTISAEKGRQEVKTLQK